MPRQSDAILWSAFALLLFLGGVRLLFGCELTIPSFLGLRFCPAAIDISAVQQEMTLKRSLEDRVHRAEVALAAAPPCITCVPRVTAKLESEFALLLDMSNSMTRSALDLSSQPITQPDGSITKKIEIAIRGLPAAIEELGDRPVSYMTFRNCIETRPIIKETGREIAQRIRSIDIATVGGDSTGSPMASVLRDAAQLFRAAPDGRYFGNILLVTDTGPECNEDPCAAAQEIASQKPGIVINVVDLENSGSMRCVTEATGGKFFARGSKVDLRQMIQEAKVFRNEVCTDASLGPAASFPDPSRR